MKGLYKKVIERPGVPLYEVWTDRFGHVLVGQNVFGIENRTETGLPHWFAMKPDVAREMAQFIIEACDHIESSNNK